LAEEILDEGGVHLPGSRGGVFLGAVDQAMEAGVVAALGQFDVELSEEGAFVLPEAEFVGFELFGIFGVDH
jgi:hypothetical protein